MSEAITLPKIRDRISGMLFLLDTGAFSNFLFLRDSDTNKKELEIDIGFGKTTATFYICAIEQTILGFHFLYQNQLTLDAQSGCFRCPDTEMKVNTIPMPVKECEASLVHKRKYTDLITESP